MSDFEEYWLKKKKKKKKRKKRESQRKTKGENLALGQAKDEIRSSPFEMKWREFIS